jgi:ArsR family transcriptional regulator, arsenate/arsenite/antimonite-responsive transcriptional repressor
VIAPRTPFAADFRLDDAEHLSVLVKALAAPARLQILHLLHQRGPLTATDLIAELGLAQPTIVHHLRILDETGLITRERDGRFVDCVLDIEALRALAGLLTPRRRHSGTRSGSSVPHSGEAFR